MQIDTNKLSSLLKEKKMDEAKKLLEDFVRSPMTEEEEGGILVSATMRHLEIMNSIEEQYIESVKSLLAELKELDTQESKAKDSEALNKVREELAKSK